MTTAQKVEASMAGLGSKIWLKEVPHPKAHHLGTMSPTHSEGWMEKEADKQRWIQDHPANTKAKVGARWVTLRAHWVTLRARWVTLRARWVTLRARWATLRARWVTAPGREQQSVATPQP